MHLKRISAVFASALMISSVLSSNVFAATIRKNVTGGSVAVETSAQTEAAESTEAATSTATGEVVYNRL